MSVQDVNLARVIETGDMMDLVEWIRDDARSLSDVYRGIDAFFAAAEDGDK